MTRLGFKLFGNPGLFFKEYKAQILGSLCILIVVGILVYNKNTENMSGLQDENEKQYSETTCVCVFDLDHTITCGIDRASTAVRECKKRNCKIAINTARPMPYYRDIKLDKLGLSEKDFKDDFYYGEFLEGLISKMTRGQLTNTISDTKSKHLKTIQDKYKILDPKRIILFDDVLANVDGAKKNGFSAIHANHPKCGLNDNIIGDIEILLDK